MPLFLRSLPLSVVTLWHYVFVLPIVIVLSIPGILLAAFPLVGILFLMGLVAFLSIIGYRCALAAFGKGNAPDIAKLVKSSLELGGLNIFAGLVILIAAGSIAFALGWLGIGESAALPGFEVFPGPLPGLTFVLFVGFAIVCHALIAVPSTALAHAGTTHSGDPGLFFGFGSGFFSIMAAWLIWLAGLVFLGLYGVVAETALFLIQVISGGQIDVPEMTGSKRVDLPPLLVALAYLMWGPCWYSATAVLAWDRVVQHCEAERLATADAAARSSAGDLRALRAALSQKADPP